MSFASTSIRSFMVLTEDDGVPGSKFEREPEYYTVDQLKRWLKCRGLKQGGKREEILKRVKDCIFSGSHRTLDSSIDDGKWFALKAIKENSELKGNNSVVSLPVIPTTGWREFQSHDIPSLFNYGHIHYYTLESIQNVGSFSDEDGLGHMTDKPMKNGRKYVDSGFVHDMMDTGTSQHYFVRAHVWPSMKMDLPHNVVIVLSVNSGAVIHASCEPCRASSLGRCSHVVAVLFSILDHVTKHGALISKPCTSKECSWNKGKKRNKDPRRLSGAKYPSKRKESSMPVIDFDPRPVQYRQVTSAQINRFVINLQSLSQNSEPSMWETQLKITYENYDLGDPSTLHQKVNILCENLTTAHLMEIPGTEGQSNSERWFSERWCRLTASKCLPAYRLGKLIVEKNPNAPVDVFKFISHNIWGIDSEPFQSFWMLYGLNSEAKAILKYENDTGRKVRSSGLWVNPKFPCLGCSPDGLVGDDTVIEIKSLKIFKEYSVQTGTASTSPVPKEVLSRQCFRVQEGKCILKKSHAYYYQCQHILLVTERKFIEFILYAESGPDSVEKIERDEPLISKILEFLTALWTRVIAPKIFEMRVPRDLLPFILPETNKDTLDDMDTNECDISSSALPGDHNESMDSYVSQSSSQAKPAVRWHTQEELNAAEALLCAFTTPTCTSSIINQGSGLTFFPWGGMTSSGIQLSNTCPLDNRLILFQALVENGKVNLAALPESGHIIGSAFKLIKDGLHADAKLLILHSLTPQPQVVSGTLDLYGNEADFFLMLLNPYMMSTTTTTCPSACCPSHIPRIRSVDESLQPSLLRKCPFMRM